jgi:hypothetical protein
MGGGANRDVNRGRQEGAWLRERWLISRDAGCGLAAASLEERACT